MFKKIDLFFKEIRQVIKEVTWPQKESLIQLTVVVILVSIVVSAFLGTSDFLFTKLIRWLTTLKTNG